MKESQVARNNLSTAVSEAQENMAETDKDDISPYKVAHIGESTDAEVGSYLQNADEVANVAELLMSDKGAFITGTDFMCDGGATASYYYGPLKPQE